ncbi:hypothetical protein A7U60_g1460 [Sanghuangporus baumii]|uniref:DUF6593 domain-containing protein n=1 Tax=Sanghuangporus baumii TaxID=108892 RepID=A0A9Q5NB91_SANBA|nr:hypothetical protein A7U60_g1460 [Sanghuangporus baumii]
MPGHVSSIIVPDYDQSAGTATCVNEKHESMGQVISVPPNHWYTSFTFDTDDLNNATITCGDLQLRYRILTKQSSGSFRGSVTSIFRNHRSVRQWDVLVAEWERHTYSTDRIRMAPDLEYNAEVASVSMNKFLPAVAPWSEDKSTFRASNGKRYIWKEQARTVMLYSKEFKRLPLAMLSQINLSRPGPMHIKLSRECEDILDEVLVTCLIAESKRRWRERISSYANIALAAASATNAAASAAASC